MADQLLQNNLVVQALNMIHEVPGNRERDESTQILAHILATAGLVIQYMGDTAYAAAAILYLAKSTGYSDYSVLEAIPELGILAETVIELATEKTQPLFTPLLERKMEAIAAAQTVPPGSRLILAAEVHSAISMLSERYRQLGDGVWKLYPNASPEEVVGFFDAITYQLREAQAEKPKAKIHKLHIGNSQELAKLSRTILYRGAIGASPSMEKIKDWYIEEGGHPPSVEQCYVVKMHYQSQANSKSVQAA